MAELYSLFAYLPFECFQAQFMQRALVGLLLFAPLTAVMGVQVVNFRLAFFSDAISHSAFAGVALGLLFAVSPSLTMPLFGLAVGMGIVLIRRHSRLSSDTVIGVFFSAVMAFGLAVISRDAPTARNVQAFLYGDILTVSDADILGLAGLCVILLLFQIVGYNRLLYIGLNPVLAKAHRVQVVLWQYAFAALLALVVTFSVRAVGVFLVTAMLIVPAATARNLARSAGSMFWWALAVSVTTTMAGLIISAQDWARTATGATIILVACLCFVCSLLVAEKE